VYLYVSAVDPGPECGAILTPGTKIWDKFSRIPYLGYWILDPTHTVGNLNSVSTDSNFFAVLVQKNLTILNYVKKWKQKRKDN
jgi:hypothetical protein